MKKVNKIKNIKTHIIGVIGYIFKLLDYLIPKKKNLIFFSMANGAYSDNSKALFEYIIKHKRDEIIAIWLTEKKNKLKHPNICYLWTLKGIWIALRGNVFITSNGLRDIRVGLYFSKRTKVVNLWHAITFKNIGLLDIKIDEKEKRNITKESEKYALFIASSHIDALSFRKCFNLHMGKIVVTGIPRNDIFFNSNYHCSDKFISSIKFSRSGKIILYAPTFRDFDKTQFFPFNDFDPSQLAYFLNDKNAFLFIRPHQNDYPNKKILEELISQYGDHFVLACNDRFPDVAEILPLVDVVITDYSSIFIDLLLKDCPPIFVPYDIKEYERERGLLYDYTSVTPGPKVNSFSEFIPSLDEALNGAAIYKDERMRVKNIFHEYDDGKSCERICKHIINLC